MKGQNHPYIPNSLPRTKQEMMREIGIKSIDELYRDVPEKYRLKKPLAIPERGLSELGLKRHVENLISKGKTCKELSAFLGAGCWPHYVPAVVKEIVHRSELLTSYTPYQPEISQGMLQALFEYQSMICELTEMDVANSSMYDWASALGEAARMASRIKNRKEILIPKIIHPERAATLETYAEPAGLSIKKVAYDPESGQLDLDDLRTQISERTAAVYVEHPSYLGILEEHVEEIGEATHANDALLIAGVDPTSLGILRTPGDYGADIVVGEAQPLGNAMNFGGPLLGIMACRDDMSIIRQMPGRIIGLTATRERGEKGFCMTLQTREQHIRRERATSNICSNEALCAIASAVYMSMLGPEGMRDLGEAIALRTRYAIQLLSKVEGVKVPIFKSSHFKEFAVNFEKTGMRAGEINNRLLELNIHGGKDISEEYPEFGQTALYCLTEVHSKEEIDSLSQALGTILAGR